jgi:hypothetical protein
MKFFIGDIALLEDPRLSATDLKVYFTLVSYMNRDTGKCFPRKATLAKKINLSLRTISRSISKLLALGFMTSKRLASTNEYTLSKHADFLANSLLFKRYATSGTPDRSNMSAINKTITNKLYNKNYYYNNFNRQQSISDTPLGKLSNKILKYNNKDLLFYQSEGVLDFYKDSEGNTFTRNRVNNEIKAEGSLKKKLKIVA